MGVIRTHTYHSVRSIKQYIDILSRIQEYAINLTPPDTRPMIAFLHLIHIATNKFSLSTIIKCNSDESLDNCNCFPINHK